MSFFDSVAGAFKGAMGEGGLQSALTQVLSGSQFSQLQSQLPQMMQQLSDGGLGEQVKSWLGNGSNLPISPEQLQAALGSDKVREIAGQLGIPVAGALQLLSTHLPQAVDQMSPNGKLETPDTPPSTSV